MFPVIQTFPTFYANDSIYNNVGELRIKVSRCSLSYLAFTWTSVRLTFVKFLERMKRAMLHHA